MAFAPLFDPTQQFMARSGAPLVGGLLYVYRNTSQSLATLKNVAGTTIANPVSLDADGRATGGVFVSDASTYTIVVKDAFEATLWTIAAMSPLGGGSGGGSEVTITPTLTTGTKIADYTIDGEAGELFAPNGGGGTEKRVGFVNTNGNVTHEISSDDIDQGFCQEDYIICHAESNANPFIAVFLQCIDFWSKNSFSSIDVYAVYEWSGNMEYAVKLFEIDSTALSNNSFKDFSVMGQVSLPSNKNVKLRFKWNLKVGASVGDDLLIKCNCFVASTELAQGLR